MVYNFVAKWGFQAQLWTSIFALLFDIFLCGVAGIIMVFAMYLFNGLEPKNLLIFGPSVMTECAVMHCYFSRMLAHPIVKAFNKRHSKWVAFSCYYGTVWVSAYVSVHLTFIALKHVWYKIESGYQGMIAMHQVLTFVTLTSHNAWMDGILLKDACPWAAAVLMFLFTWIVWGVWVHHSFDSDMDNLGQLGGYIQWIPLTNLMNVSIFKDLDLRKSFKNIVTRFGHLGAATLAVNFYCWAVCYGLNYWRFNKEWAFMNSFEVGHGIWGMSALSWLPFQIIGHRLSPFIFKNMCLDKYGNKNWYLVAAYWFLMSILAVLVGACFYFFFNNILYDYFICEVLKGGSKLTRWYMRPSYFFGFGIGTQYICFVECKEFSKDGLVEIKSRHEKKAPQKVEAVMTGDAVQHQ